MRWCVAAAARGPLLLLLLLLPRICSYRTHAIALDIVATLLCVALLNKDGTCLFRHEIAYVLGQMEASTAIPTLEKVLRDPTDDPIVRHECGEALGAIAAPETLNTLEELSSDPIPEVGDTLSRTLLGSTTLERHEGHPLSLMLCLLGS